MKTQVESLKAKLKILGVEAPAREKRFRFVAAEKLPLQLIPDLANPVVGIQELSEFIERNREYGEVYFNASVSRAFDNSGPYIECLIREELTDESDLFYIRDLANLLEKERKFRMSAVGKAQKAKEKRRKEYEKLKAEFG